MAETDYYELAWRRSAPPTARRSSPRIGSWRWNAIPTGTAAAPTRKRKFKAISEAYDCLKDPQKRAAYDRFGHAAFQNGGGGDPFGGGQGFDGFSDIFSSIFGEFMDPRGAARQRGARRRTCATIWN